MGCGVSSVNVFKVLYIPQVLCLVLTPEECRENLKYIDTTITSRLCFNMFQSCRSKYVSDGKSAAWSSEGKSAAWSSEKRRDYDRHGLGSKLTRAIMLCPWKKRFTALSPAWWSWQAVLSNSHISMKLKKQTK